MIESISCGVLDPRFRGDDGRVLFRYLSVIANQRVDGTFTTTYPS
jgi:hypothetical protein